MCLPSTSHVFFVIFNQWIRETLAAFLVQPWFLLSVSTQLSTSGTVIGITYSNVYPSSIFYRYRAFYIVPGSRKQSHLHALVWSMGYFRRLGVSLCSQNASRYPEPAFFVTEMLMYIATVYKVYLKKYFRIYLMLCVKLWCPFVTAM